MKLSSNKSKYLNQFEVIRWKRSIQTFNKYNKILIIGFNGTFLSISVLFLGWKSNVEFNLWLFVGQNL